MQKSDSKGLDRGWRQDLEQIHRRWEQRQRSLHRNRIALALLGVAAVMVLTIWLFAK